MWYDNAIAKRANSDERTIMQQLLIQNADDTISATVLPGYANDDTTCEVDDHAIPVGAKLFTDDSGVTMCADHFIEQLFVFAFVFPATNDICTSHDVTTDVHDAHPTDCRACTVAGPTFACLSHTCPDCGSIVHATLNDRNELIHNCP